MAERIEEPDVEVTEPAATGSDSVAATMTAALRRRRSSAKADPEFDAFLRKQSRLIDLQTEHLHEQRQVILLRLRLGSWKDSITLALQGLTVFVGLAVAAAIAVMAWQAHEDHGLTITAFSVPPDLAQRGLTGQVVAARVLDRLSELQAQTVSSRPASSYADNWGDDIKVEIPETGVSVGELNQYLRRWLGSETRITGEVVRASTGLAVTARAGAEPGRSFTGADADMDALIAQAAEAIYATTQPYRYAVYLASHGRQAEALKTFAELVVSGPPGDRAWAYAGWASIEQGQGRFADAARLAQAAIDFEPRLQPASPILASSLDAIGRPEAVLKALRHEIELVKSGRAIGLPRAAFERRLQILRGLEAYELGNYRTALSLIEAGSVDLEGRPGASHPSFPAIKALIYNHDVSASRRTGTIAGEVVALQAWMMEDWPTVIQQAQRSASVVSQALAAEAYVRSGRPADAFAVIGRTPRDCYACLEARGAIAGATQDWAGADRWYGEAARQGPSLPFAHAGWGQVLLARGNADAAIAKFTEAHRRSPHFADPLELWGEALMWKGEFNGAIAKFREADKDAPRWGRNHLRWGEALMLADRFSEARARYEAANSMDLSKPDRAALNVLLARTANGPLHR